MEQTKITATQCANCSTELQGKFCYKCGEKQVDPDRDFSALHFFKETLESLIHLDSKILRTFWCILLAFVLQAATLAGTAPYFRITLVGIFYIIGYTLYDYNGICYKSTSIRRYIFSVFTHTYDDLVYTSYSTRLLELLKMRKHKKNLR